MGVIKNLSIIGNVQIVVEGVIVAEVYNSDAVKLQKTIDELKAQIKKLLDKKDPTQPTTVPTTTAPVTTAPATVSTTVPLDW